MNMSEYTVATQAHYMWHLCVLLKKSVNIKWIQNWATSMKFPTVGNKHQVVSGVAAEFRV